MKKKVLKINIVPGKGGKRTIRISCVLPNSHFNDHDIYTKNKHFVLIHHVIKTLFAEKINRDFIKYERGCDMSYICFRFYSGLKCIAITKYFLLDYSLFLYIKPS